MPEDTGQATSKPKSKQREFVKYQDLSKEDLVRMLMRINKRLSRISRELREVTDILYYGYTQGEGRNSNRKSGRQKRSKDEDVNYE